VEVVVVTVVLGKAADVATPLLVGWALDDTLLVGAHSVKATIAKMPMRCRKKIAFFIGGSLSVEDCLKKCFGYF